PSMEETAAADLETVESSRRERRNELRCNASPVAGVYWRKCRRMRTANCHSGAQPTDADWPRQSIAEQDVLETAGVRTKQQRVHVHRSPGLGRGRVARDDIACVQLDPRLSGIDACVRIGAKASWEIDTLLI